MVKMPGLLKQMNKWAVLLWQTIDSPCYDFDYSKRSNSISKDNGLPKLTESKRTCKGQY